MIGPGITIGTGAVLCLGSVATHDLDSWQIHRGAPATAVKSRRCRDIEPVDAEVRLAGPGLSGPSQANRPACRSG
jgi:acetyltransferase-like isoleucine patch superfamily enzyme